MYMYMLNSIFKVVPWEYVNYFESALNCTVLSKWSRTAIVFRMYLTKSFYLLYGKFHLFHGISTWDDYWDDCRFCLQRLEIARGSAWPDTRILRLRGCQKNIVIYVTQYDNVGINKLDITNCMFESSN